jgi:hypothetical protein
VLWYCAAPAQLTQRGDIMAMLNGAQWYPQQTRDVVETLLNAVTCEGERRDDCCAPCRLLRARCHAASCSLLAGDTLLITLPVLTKISSTIDSVVQGVQVRCRFLYMSASLLFALARSLAHVLAGCLWCALSL